MIGIVSRLDRQDAIACALRLSRLLKDYDEDVRIEYNLWRVAGREGKPFTIGESVDVLVVVGGDGTLLRALHYYAHSVKVLGVRVGRRGYYMAFTCDEFVKNGLPEKIVWRRYPRIVATRVDDYARLTPALNEIAILASKGKVIDIIIETKVLSTRVSGDGVLIATPSGSHAYNKSARGPLLASNNVVVITPLNPVEETSSSSIVVDINETITMRSVHGYRTAWIIIDGQITHPLPLYSSLEVKSGSPVEVAYPR